MVNPLARLIHPLYGQCTKKGLGTVPDHVTFLNQVTYSGNLVQTELPIERKPNQITFG